MQQQRNSPYKLLGVLNTRMTCTHMKSHLHNMYRTRSLIQYETHLYLNRYLQSTYTLQVSIPRDFVGRCVLFID